MVELLMDLRMGVQEGLHDEARGSGTAIHCRASCHKGKQGAPGIVPKAQKFNAWSCVTNPSLRFFRFATLVRLQYTAAFHA